MRIRCSTAVRPPTTNRSSLEGAAPSAPQFRHPFTRPETEMRCAAGGGGRLIWIRALRGRVVVISDKKCVVAPHATQVLQALLLGDAKEPRGKLGVVPQARDVAHGGGKCLLHGIEGRSLVVEDFRDVSVQWQLMSLEQGIPGVGRMSAGGGQKFGVG